MNLAPFTRFELSTEQKVALCDLMLREHTAPRTAQVNYVAIARELNWTEARALKDLDAALTDVQDALLATLNRSFDVRKTKQAWVNDLSLRGFSAVRKRLQDMMQEAAERGVLAVEREVPVRTRLHASRATVSPKAAIKAMRDKALWVSGVLEGELVKRTQGILTQALRNGEALGETVQKVKEAWLPYMGDATIIQDAEQLQPYRLKTIVRTNTTDAYNTGRLAKMRDPDLDEWVQGVRYEAVIDERTTELCAGLDGLVFRKDDPDLDRLTPPNHFNCRSLLIPVLIDEQVPADKFATQRDIGTALDRMDAGFGGVAKYDAVG